MGVERREVIIQFLFIQENCPCLGGIRRATKMSETKPFKIERQWVMDAYQRVKANRGVAGVDEMSLEEFDKDYKKHLYRIWNRMSSGSYIPPPVMLVEIPKKEKRGKSAYWAFPHRFRSHRLDCSNWFIGKGG